ncbi:MAG TPA: hypothetical protein VN782_15710 [Usitatibacter sp.]|nr:hypothetical protein [Usitatibacter sp.]
MDPVVHFEMPYESADRVAKFYEAVFGWKMQPMGPQMGGYVLAGTGATGADGRPKEPGVGAYVSFVDTEGNRASLLQPLPMAKT